MANIKQITSAKNDFVSFVYDLVHEKKTRDKHGLFVVENKTIITEALDSNHSLDSIFIDQEVWKKDQKSVFFYALYSDLNIYIVADHILKKLSTNNTTPKLIGVFKTNQKALTYQDNLIVLDHIQDPGNLGTILRTAVAFGIKEAILVNCVDVYNSKVIKASSGALFKIKTQSFNDLKQLLTVLQANNYALVCSVLDERAISLTNLQKPSKFALVFGNEGHGSSLELINSADYLVQIPMNNMQSLNVSIAAGILMYELCTK